MKKGRKITLMMMTVLGMSFISLPLQSSSSGCARCDQIREDNKLHHHNYEYYEDYEKQETDKPTVAPAVKKAQVPVAVPPKVENAAPAK